MGKKLSETGGSKFREEGKAQSLRFEHRTKWCGDLVKHSLTIRARGRPRADAACSREGQIWGWRPGRADRGKTRDARQIFGEGG
jgi:hypothetical protein